MRNSSRGYFINSSLFALCACAAFAVAAVSFKPSNGTGVNSSMFGLSPGVTAFQMGFHEIVDIPSRPFWIQLNDRWSRGYA